MKPHLLALVFLWLTALPSFAQGTINVGNGITASRFPIYGPQVADPSIQVVGNGPLSAPTGSTVFTGGLLSGTRYVIEFWAGPASATDFSGLSLITSTTFRTSASPASLPNGLTLTTTGVVPGVGADQQAKLGVRVYDTQSGGSYATAFVRAQSALFLSGPLGGGLTLNPNWIGQSFSLVSPPPAPSAPSITTPPASAAVVVGQAASLSVTAAGTGPLRYQWRKAGSPIGDATNSVLSFASVALGDAGYYDVVVTNFYGSATSAVAVLQVTLSNAPNIQVNGQLAIDSIAVGSPATVTISGGFPGGFIFYTTDGSPPTISATLYSGGFSLTNSQTVRAMSLSADFSQTSEAPPLAVIILTTYELASTVNGSGSISRNPAVGPYLSNVVVSLTAVPSANWAFAQWSGDISGSVNPTSVTMNGPRSVQATFVPTAYPLTLTTPGGGSVTANGVNIAAHTYYPTGSVVSLAATPTGGWSFLGWEGSATSSVNPLGLTMTQTQIVQAVFGTVVNSNIAGAGSVNFSLPNPVAFGSLVTATATPSVGYYFVTWSGALTGTNNPANFSVTTATPTVGALFAAYPAPLITIPPASTNVVIGNPAGFTVSATGSAPLSYQWRHAGTNLPGATSAQHLIAAASLTDAGPYDVIVVNSTGGSITSSVATLTLLFPPTIAQSPQSTIVINGSNTSFSVSATGTAPLTYQWRHLGLPLGGAPTPNLDLPGVTTNESGSYDVVVSNPYGAVTSSVATLTVVFPPSFISSPLPQTLPVGGLLNLTVTAAGTDPLSYQWYLNGFPVLDATNTHYLVSSGQLTDAGNYSVVVSNPYGVLTSAVATVTVYLPVMFTLHPASQVVPLSGTAVFAAAADAVPAPNFQWLFDGALIPGATNPSLVLTNIGTNVLGNFSLLAWNEYSAATSSVATLFMSPSLRVPFTGATVVWGKEAILSVGAVGSGALSYQWYQDGVPVSGGTNATLIFPVVQINQGGLYTVVVTSPFGSVTNTPAQLVVNPASVSLGFYAGITISGVPGYTYGIEYSTNLADLNGWYSITNVTLSQPVERWLDSSIESQVPGNNGRFYRVTAP